MRSIKSMAAMARRECDTNGLPAGEYTYTNKCENQDKQNVRIFCHET